MTGKLARRGKRDDRIPHCSSEAKSFHHDFLLPRNCSTSLMFVRAILRILSVGRTYQSGGICSSILSREQFCAAWRRFSPQPVVFLASISPCPHPKSKCPSGSSSWERNVSLLIPEPLSPFSIDCQPSNFLSSDCLLRLKEWK